MTAAPLRAYIEWKGWFDLGRHGILRIYAADPIHYVWTCYAERYRFNRKLHLQGFLEGPTKSGFKAIRQYCLDRGFVSVIWEAVTPEAVTHVELFARTWHCERYKTDDVAAFLARVKR